MYSAVLIFVLNCRYTLQSAQMPRHNIKLSPILVHAGYGTVRGANQEVFCGLLQQFSPALGLFLIDIRYPNDPIIPAPAKMLGRI